MPMTRQNYFWIRASLLSLFVFFAISLFFWGILAYNIPPLDGSISAADLAQHFRDHAVRLRIGYGVALPMYALMLPWSVAVFALMRRIEGGDGILSYIQLGGGILTVVVMSMGNAFWLTAAFRPETDPAIIQMLYDAGWLTVDLFFGVTTLQYCALALVLLQDRAPKKLAPKWFLWLGFWLSIEFMLEIIMPHFRSGPFSWSGLLNYWLPFFGPITWVTVMTIILYRSVHRFEEEDRAALAASSS